MSRFIPVTYQDDGQSVFRNDLVDIEFTINGNMVTKRFNLGFDLAPPLPFRRTGIARQNDRELCYAIDSNASVWLESEDEMFMQTPRVLLDLVKQYDYPEAKYILSTIEIIQEQNYAEAD